MRTTLRDRGKHTTGYPLTAADVLVREMTADLS